MVPASLIAGNVSHCRHTLSIQHRWITTADNSKLKLPLLGSTARLPRSCRACVCACRHLRALPPTTPSCASRASRPGRPPRPQPRACSPPASLPRSPPAVEKLGCHCWNHPENRTHWVLQYAMLRDRLSFLFNEHLLPISHFSHASCLCNMSDSCPVTNDMS